MRYVEAPTDYERAADGDRTLFLAGGITGVPNWQAEAVRLLDDAPVVVFNPRQPNFDVSNPHGATDQIAWEVRHLRQADVTLFWFSWCDPTVTVQPIALFELGMALGDARCWGRRLVVGTAPDYPRRVDVVEQCRHAKPDLTVYQHLDETVSEALVAMFLDPADAMLAVLSVNAPALSIPPSVAEAAERIRSDVREAIEVCYGELGDKSDSPEDVQGVERAIAADMRTVLDWVRDNP